jgi:hypothetical protein
MVTSKSVSGSIKEIDAVTGVPLMDAAVIFPNKSVDVTNTLPPTIAGVTAILVTRGDAVDVDVEGGVVGGGATTVSTDMTGFNVRVGVRVVLTEPGTTTVVIKMVFPTTTTFV